jgi:hypothetical protein
MVKFYLLHLFRVNFLIRIICKVNRQERLIIFLAYLNNTGTLAIFLKFEHQTLFLFLEKVQSFPQLRQFIFYNFLISFLALRNILLFFWFMLVHKVIVFLPERSLADRILVFLKRHDLTLILFKPVSTFIQSRF